MTLREFDRMPDGERDYWIADWDLSRRECPQHGGPLEDCQDPEKPWHPQRQVCRAAMETAAASALYAELHEKAPYHDGTFEAWADKRSRSHPYHYLDGVTIFAAPEDLNPDDDFLTG